jgi:hypothetical protein
MLAIIAVSLMMPFASFAMTAISDKDLDAVTAKEGIVIFFDNITTNLSMATLSWGDSDGFGTTYTDAGYVGASNITITGNYRAINGAMTIDIGSNVTTHLMAVQIGLPTITYGGTAGMNVSATLKLSPNQDLSGGNSLGTIDIRGWKTTVNGTVTLSGH